MGFEGRHRGVVGRKRADKSMKIDSKRDLMRATPGVGAHRTQIIFLGNGRCYHTFDWYRNAQELLAPQPVPFVTDLVDSEGHLPLLRSEDPRINLINIDWLMFSKQSTGGNIWRNLIKTLMIPMQVSMLRRIARQQCRYGPVKFHAHSMYYLILCWLAGVNYVGTPQGSEILVRPYRSRIYRAMAKRALVAADHVTVDSINMQRGVRELSGREAILVQNGIDVSVISKMARRASERTTILSNRGFYSLYRIDQIIAGRNRTNRDLALAFCYPSWEDNYKAQCLGQCLSIDRDLGRLPTRKQMYELLFGTLLVISIPESDSSPRSIYEAIFCGCCVATIYNPWIELITDCMKARLHLVDLEDENWFVKAVSRAREITCTPYVPSEAAAELFDQKQSLRRLAALCYFVQK